MREQAAANDADLVTTEKDLSRVGRETDAAEKPRLLALRIEAEPFEPEPLLRAVREVVRGTGT